MKDLDIATLTLFEIVPTERLGLKEPANDIQYIVQALEKSGLELIDHHASSAYQFALRDNECFKQLVAASLPEEEDELRWLLTNFFEYLLLLPTEYDLLFALFSTRERLLRVDNLALEVGRFEYPPALARVICARALKQAGVTELGNSIDTSSSYPKETAAAGAIFFEASSLEFEIALHDLNTGLSLRPLSLLSSKLLLSQEIIALLQDATLLDTVVLAQILPLQVYGSTNADTSKFSLFNFLWIKAKIGSLSELLQELAGISLHLNWSQARSYTERLSKKLALSFGFRQMRRLKRLEEKENTLKHSLNILQKRYPMRSDLIEWEVNNLYSNIVRYSPVYLAWRAHLKAFVQGDPDIDNQFTLLVRQVDWASLEELNITARDEADRIVDLLQNAPGMLLTEMRVLIEKAITYLYVQKYSHSTHVNLHNMIQKLDRDRIFPAMISIYLVTLRTSGNVGAHTGAGSKEDIEVLLPLFVRVLEWFLDEGIYKV